MGSTTFSGPVTSTGGFVGDVTGSATGGSPVAAGSTVTVTAAQSGKTILLDTATGSVVTLPAASGTGNSWVFEVSVTVTSNDHVIQVANASDEFAGVIWQIDTDTTDTVAAYPAIAADNYDTITMNGTTTGGLIGDRIVVKDIATNVFSIHGVTNANGVVATPLSAAV